MDARIMTLVSALLILGCSAPVSKTGSNDNSTPTNSATNAATNGDSNAAMNSSTNSDSNAATNSATNGWTNNTTFDSGFLLIEPSELAFMTVTPGEIDEQFFEVTNRGAEVITLTGATIVEETRTDDGGEEFVKGVWPEDESLVPQETTTFSVTYFPEDWSADTGYVRLGWTDGVDSGTARIELITPELKSGIYMSERVIFRSVPPVTEETRDTFWVFDEIYNIGEAPLVIHDIVIAPSDSDYSLSFPENLDPEADPATDSDEPRTWTLHPGESMPLRIYFNPENDFPSSAELVIYSNDPENPEYVVVLTGNTN